MSKVVNIAVIRAKQRPPDVVFTVEFWRLADTRWWHEPFALMSKIGPLSPKDIRMFGHAIVDDGQAVWDLGGAPRPPKRKAVKRRLRRHR